MDKEDRFTVNILQAMMQIENGVPRKIAAVLLCVMLPLLFKAQSGMTFQLRSAVEEGKSVEKHATEKSLIPLFVLGDPIAIVKEVNRLNGNVITVIDHMAQIELPANTVEKFIGKSFVQEVKYPSSKGMLLADEMLENNNITGVHDGNGTLLQPYTGSGVILGFIDSGIDITHPDFQDSLGNTRILAIWDQVADTIWDSVAINNGSCTHIDSLLYEGHGTHVAGIAAGNGLAIDQYKGVAPEAEIIMVASDFDPLTWESDLVEAVQFIYDVADSLGKPCVINISAGTYSGSHDGTDIPAQMINTLVNEKPGRVLVCSAGNEGNRPFHVQHQISADTTFTWFKYNPTSGLGYGAVFFEVWADTADLNDVQFAIGANLPTGNYDFRGNTSFWNIKDSLGILLTDTIENNGNTIGVVNTYAEVQGSKYLLQVHLGEPDSNSYLFSFMTTGSGKLDIWSDSDDFFATSDIVQSPLPDSATYPNIVFYQKPDTLQTMVSGFSCLPSVLTVGNVHNRNSYLNNDSVAVTNTNNIGEISPSSSLGPTRIGNLKPDISATGSIVLASGAQNTVDYYLGLGGGNINSVAFGGKHIVKSGTSMSSPVVAGIAALYLEKCPNASMTEIKNAITSTAIQDFYTGTTPNNTYGYGKVDGYAALTISDVVINLDDHDMCAGDSVELTAPALSSYLWSTSDTTASIYIDTTTSVVLEAWNSSGCKGVSNTATITARPFPVKPMLTLIGNDTIVASTIHDVSWYRNDTLLVGENDTLHIALVNGSYFAQVTSEYDCSTWSDTISVTLPVVSVNENIIGNGWEAFPNPASDALTIQLEKDYQLAIVSILNPQGKVLISKNVVGKAAFNIESLARGIYLLQVETNGAYHIKRIMLN